MKAATREVILKDSSPETICFVGDSEARVFDGMLFEDPARPGENILTVVRRRPYFRAANFFAGGRFDEEMTRIWWELNCVRPTSAQPLPDIFTPIAYHVFGEVVEYRRVAAYRPQDRTIVVTCGVDAWDIEQELFPRYTFDLDPAPRGLDLLPEYAAAEVIEQSVIFDRIERRLEPLFAGLRALQSAGFARLFLWGIPPPSLEGPPRLKPPRLLYLVRSAFNRVLKRFADEHGIGFLSTWEWLAGENGLRDPRYFQDLEHINVDGALIVMNNMRRLPAYG